MIFDGKKFAANKIQRLLRLPEEKRKKKLVVLLDPNNTQGASYVRMKQKLAERLGVEFVVYDTPDVESWNADLSVDGIMVQLPYPGSEEIISQISPIKDVDGLREESMYLMGVTRGVLEVLKVAVGSMSLMDLNVVVLGSSGVVGASVMDQLHKLGLVNLVGMDAQTMDLEKLKKADVVITATGVQGLFTADMVSEGAIIIDVGFPKGDFDLEVSKKASFYTPVPGGVGPVTVVSLFENLLLGKS